jgi:hypothetical protein
MCSLVVLSFSLSISEICDIDDSSFFLFGFSWTFFDIVIFFSIVLGIFLESDEEKELFSWFFTVGFSCGRI